VVFRPERKPKRSQISRCPRPGDSLQSQSHIQRLVNMTKMLYPTMQDFRFVFYVATLNWSDDAEKNLQVLK